MNLELDKFRNELSDIFVENELTRILYIMHLEPTRYPTTSGHIVCLYCDNPDTKYLSIPGEEWLGYYFCNEHENIALRDTHIYCRKENIVSITNELLDELKLIGNIKVKRTSGNIDDGWCISFLSNEVSLLSASRVISICNRHFDNDYFISVYKNNTTKNCMISELLYLNNIHVDYKLILHRYLMHQTPLVEE